MKTLPATNYENLVSDFTRRMWEVEAEHPVFAGSLNNIRLLVAVEKKKRPARKPARAKKVAATAKRQATERKAAVR